MIRMIFRRYSGAGTQSAAARPSPCNAAGKGPSPRPGTQPPHTDSKAATSFARPHSEPGVRSEAPDGPWLVSVFLAGQHRRRFLSGLDPGAAGADTTRCRPLRLPRACEPRRLSLNADLRANWPRVFFRHGGAVGNSFPGKNPPTLKIEVVLPSGRSREACRLWPEAARGVCAELPTHSLEFVLLENS